MSKGFELLPHTTDLKIRAYGATFLDFFRNTLVSITRQNKLIIYNVIVVLLPFYSFSMQPFRDNLFQLHYMLTNLHVKAPKAPPAFTLTSNGIQATKDLLNDFKYYITDNIYFHEGDLYEHSIWTSNTVTQWWDNKSFWTEGLSQRDKILSILTGLIHDIGKAGDLKYYFRDKADHPITSFRYFLHKLIYKLAPLGTPFDIGNYLNKLGFSKEDQSLISIAIGMHWSFGAALRAIYEEGKPRDQVLKKYLTDLRCEALQAGYNYGKIDEHLIRFCILISAADVRGSAFNALDQSKNIFGLSTPPIPKVLKPLLPNQPPAPVSMGNPWQTHIEIVPVNKKPFNKFEFESKGKTERENLLSYFATHKTTLEQPINITSCPKEVVA